MNENKFFYDKKNSYYWNWWYRCFCLGSLLSLLGIQNFWDRFHGLILDSDTEAGGDGYFDWGTS